MPRSVKGQAEFLEWFPRLVMLLVAVLVIVMLVRYFTDREIDTADLHRETYLYRLYYDDIIMFSDETGRVYPGVVDLEKFISERLDSMYGVTGKISSSLTISGCVDRTIHHDIITYEKNLPFARFGTLGDGGATFSETLMPVTVHDKGERCAGVLNITVVRPNS